MVSLYFPKQRMESQTENGVKTENGVIMQDLTPVICSDLRDPSDLRADLVPGM
ncbi:MAG: hypothetical protein HW380_2611 [Magnetococcales bacterium]|nr:hypothetical protein [Magnetococcales bacterium]